MYRYEGESNEQVRETVNALSDEIAELKRFQQNCEQDKELALRVQLAEKMMTHATNYTNLLLVAGYAGFFGFWSTIVNRLPQRVYAIAGLLALTSLILFISWEIVKMVSMYRRLSRNNEILKKIRRVDNALLMHEAAMNLHSMRMNKLWKWFLIPTVTTGISAALLLLGTLVCQVWQSML